MPGPVSGPGISFCEEPGRRLRHGLNVTVTVTCGRPTRDGTLCDRLVSSPGAPCGVDHAPFERAFWFGDADDYSESPGASLAAPLPTVDDFEAAVSSPQNVAFPRRPATGVSGPSEAPAGIALELEDLREPELVGGSTQADYEIRARLDSLSRYDSSAFETGTGNFRYVFVTADRDVDDEDAARMWACIGYAFRAQLRNPDGLSQFVRLDADRFVAYYDSSRATGGWRERLHDALQDASDYIREGTPVRQSNRAGPGTRGTRLCDGVGELEVAFHFGVP